MIRIVTLAILTQFVTFFGAGLFHVNPVTYRQLITPSRLLGRMNASVKTVMLFGLPFGAIVGSVIAESSGPRTALVAGSLGIVLAPIPLLLSGIAQVHEQPAHIEG